MKLVRSGFAGKCAILIYGFEDPQRPLDWLIEAFEAVAARTAVLDRGGRRPAPTGASRVRGWPGLRVGNSQRRLICELRPMTIGR